MEPVLVFGIERSCEILSLYMVRLVLFGKKYLAAVFGNDGVAVIETFGEFREGMLSAVVIAVEILEDVFRLINALVVTADVGP